MALKTLILFDIDGTLIDSGGAGRRSLDRAFYRLTGIKNGTSGILPDGKTDPLIIKEMFLKHLKREPTREEMNNMESLYLEFLKEEVETSQGYRVLKGVPKLLEMLSKIESFILGLGTGNYREGARLKLGRADLFRYFEVGGFGSDSWDRVEVLRMAIERGRDLCIRRGDKLGKAIVVGDTPYDIKAGKKAQALTVGIASGRFTLEILKREGADEALESLEDAETFINIVEKLISKRGR